MKISLTVSGRGEERKAEKPARVPNDWEMGVKHLISSRLASDFRMWASVRIAPKKKEEKLNRMIVVKDCTFIRCWQCTE